MLVAQRTLIRRVLEEEKLVKQSTPSLSAARDVGRRTNLDPPYPPRSLQEVGY